jgi:hypothetical protein
MELTVYGELDALFSVGYSMRLSFDSDGKNRQIANLRLRRPLPTSASMSVSRLLSALLLMQRLHSKPTFPWSAAQYGL